MLHSQPSVYIDDYYRMLLLFGLTVPYTSKRFGPTGRIKQVSAHDSKSSQRRSFVAFEIFSARIPTGGLSRQLQPLWHSWGKTICGASPTVTLAILKWQNQRCPYSPMLSIWRFAYGAFFLIPLNRFLFTNAGFRSVEKLDKISEVEKPKEKMFSGHHAWFILVNA